MSAELKDFWEWQALSYTLVDFGDGWRDASIADKITAAEFTRRAVICSMLRACPCTVVCHMMEVQTARIEAMEAGLELPREHLHNYDAGAPVPDEWCHEHERFASQGPPRPLLDIKARVEWLHSPPAEPMSWWGALARRMWS